MTAETSNRRGFLRGLAALPLIGGSVALVGNPSAVAVSIGREALWDYKDWLFFEHRMTCFELAGHDLARCREIERYGKGGNQNEWHLQWTGLGRHGPAGWIDAPQPSTRAALVLSAVGCDWSAAL